jgi:GT2 family glycosyltransferase/glycosyltransferase involved in cell wall biosynthesis
MPGEPMVSVVVVNYRRPHDTITCLRALRDELDYPADRLRLVCVDNASGDGSAAEIAKAVPDVHLVEAPDNLGFAGGCNLGVQHATGEIIGLLNSDARPHPSWVSAAVEVFGTQPGVGAVASKVLDWDGERIDYAGSALSWFGMGFKPGYHQRDGERFDTTRDVLFGTGAAMFVRAELYRELGGFDERLFMFYEDVDLGWRLNLRGHRVRYEPASVAYHRHHASVAGSGQFREYYLLERNALIMLYKNLEQSTLDKVLPAALALAIRRGTARGDVDPTQFELASRGDGDDEPAMSVPKVAMSSVLAVDRFVELLPRLRAAREAEQAARVRSDAALRPLLGDANEPLLELPRYLHAHEVITEAFGIEDALTRRRRVLVITGDAVSDRMAGPAIRAWNIARVLSDEHEVRLVSTNSCQVADAPFEVAATRKRELPEHVEWADIVIMQGWVLEQVPALKTDPRPVLVCDLYDPMHLEVLAQERDLDDETRHRVVQATVHALSEQLRRGDFFLCASERQRHLWLGHLSALGRFTPELYDADPSTRSLLTVVPFGLPDQPPRRTGAGPRGTVDGVGGHDKVVLWAGGVYSWFDPLTLVRAVHRLRERHDDVRLIFLGMHHPNPDIPEMGVAHDLRALASRLGLTDKHVFFNETWVPYGERHNWLLDADCGVTTHFEHVETTFAFRTRVLDYLWAGLPIVTTDGDSFAELVRAEGLGVVVPAEDPDALADALARVLYDERFAAECRRRVEAVRERFGWPAVLEPLVRFCRDPRPAPDRRPGSAGLTGPRGPRGPVTERLRADLDLARQYLTDGGVTEVARRAAGRVKRLVRERRR